MRHKGLDRPRLPGGLGGSWLLQAGMQCAAECLHTLNWKMSCHTQIIWLTAWKLADSGSLDGWNTLHSLSRMKISTNSISNNRFSLPPLCPRFANMYLCWVSVRHPEHKIDCNAWVAGGRGGGGATWCWWRQSMSHTEPGSRLLPQYLWPIDWDSLSPPSWCPRTAAGCCWTRACYRRWQNSRSLHCDTALVRAARAAAAVSTLQTTRPSWPGHVGVRGVSSVWSVS